MYYFFTNMHQAPHTNHLDVPFRTYLRTVDGNSAWPTCWGNPWQTRGRRRRTVDGNSAWPTCQGIAGDIARILLMARFLPIFTDFSDFVGRLQPSKTTIQRTPDTLGVEESSSPRRVLIRVNRTARRGDRKNIRALRLPRREIWPEARRAR